MKKTIPHIMVVASYFYPKIGGLENYAYLLAKNLHTSGNFRVTILTSNYDGVGYKKEIIDGMTVHRLPISFKVSNTPINLSWYGEVRRIFAEDMPDIVHLHSPVPYLPDIAAVAANKIPVVLTYHSGSMLKNKWPVDLIIHVYEKIFLRALFRRSAAIVAISQEFAKRTFPQFMYKTFFIPTGVDLSRFTKTPLPTETEVVTFVGRIEHASSWKGIEQLLQAFVQVLKERPLATLELVGGGDALDHYKTRARELGIEKSVVFSGPLLGPELVKAFERTQMIVLPSTSDSEAFSITLVEAMASGRPIIGTRIGGTPQVITDGKNGLLVAPKNPNELAHAILRVLTDKQLAAHLADTGAEMSLGFSWDIQAKKYADLFNAILKK